MRHQRGPGRMSINLVTEDALPKSSYLVAELRRDHDLDGSEADRPGNGKDHFAAPGASLHEPSADEALLPDRG